MFVWGLDANIPPEEWKETLVGDKTWFDFMGAELITVSNSTFTCRGKLGEAGGSMIDYFIISQTMVPLVRLLCAVFDTPWGPHFGLMLTLNARPGEVFQRILVKPTLPKGAIEMQKPQPMKKQQSIECNINRNKATAEEEAT